MQRLKKISSFDKVVTIILLLSPILQTYGWGKFDFAFILTVFLAIIHVFRKGFQVSKVFPKWLLLYILFWYFSHVLASSSISGFFPLGLFRVLLVYYLFFDCVNLDYLLSKYKLIAAICIGFFFVQELSMLITHNRISGVFSFLPLALDVDSEQFFERIITGDRSSSFFSEPAHFVQFLLPLLSICFLYYRKAQIIWIIVLISTLLLCQSGNALFGISAVLIVYLFKKGADNAGFRRFGSFFAAFLVVLSLGYLYLSSERGQDLLLRKDSISLKSVEDRGYGGSGFMRVSRGYYVFKEYSTLNKIIGDDNPDDILDAIHQSRASGFFGENDMYLNTAQTILCYTGIIGSVLFILVLISLWKSTSVCGKSIVLTFLVLSFIASLFFTETMALYLVLPYLISKKMHASNEQ